MKQSNLIKINTNYFIFVWKYK